MQARTVLMTSLVALIGAVMLVACSDDVQRRVVNGVEIVENPRFGRWQDENRPVRLELERSFGKEEEPAEEVFSWITYVFTDSAAAVYFYDFYNSRLVSYREDGRLRWVKGRKGQGPGEFQTVLGVAFDGRFIYVANQSGHRIDKFDLNGDFVQTLDLTGVPVEHPLLLGFWPPAKLLFLDVLVGACGGQLRLVDISGRPSLVGEQKIQEDLGFPLSGGFSMVPMAMFNKDFVAISSEMEFRFRLFDGNLREFRQIVREFPGLRPPVLTSTVNRPVEQFFTLGPLLQLSRNRLVSYLSWEDGKSESMTDESRRRHSLDFWTADGELLYSMEDIEIGTPVHVDQLGRLYMVVSEPFPRLRRYRVVMP